MEHYVQPTLHKKPKLAVLHVGTNDLQYKEPKELADGMKLLCQGIVTKNPTTEIAISEIVRRQDSAVNNKIHRTKHYCLIFVKRPTGTSLDMII